MEKRSVPAQLAPRGLLSDPTLPGPQDLSAVWEALKGLLTPPDPYADAGKAVEEYRAGKPLDAFSTMSSSIPLHGMLVPAHPKKAAAAAEMLQKGAPQEDIWKKTGTIRGSDNVWLQDVPSDEMHLKSDALDQLQEHGKFIGKLSDAVEHGRLYEAVPGLLNTEANLYLGPQFAVNPGAKPVPGKSGFAGNFDPKANGILAQADRIDRIGPWAPDASSLNLMDTIAHEATHAAQQATGTPNGGSSSHFASNVWNGVLAPYAHEYQKTGLIPVPADADKSLLAQVKKATGGQPFDITVQQMAKQPDEVLRYLKTAFDRQTPNGKLRGPFDAYYRLQGEANARLGEMRRKVGPTLNKYVSPAQTLDATAGQPRWGDLFPAYGPWWKNLDLGN